MALKEGVTHTQADCDTYLAEITNYQNTHDWMSGVSKTYSMTRNDWNGTELVFESNYDYTGAGALDFYPAWRVENPSVTEVGSDQDSHTWEQWDYFTNRRSDWDAEAATLGEDLGEMRNHHAEMLASIPE